MVVCGLAGVLLLVAVSPHLEGESDLATTLHFPDYVDGGGWSVQLALSNVDPTAAAAVVVTAYDQEGQPGPELFDAEATFEIPSRGSRVLRSAGGGSIRRGWIQVQSQAASVRGLLTYRHGKTGIEVGVEPVPLRDHFALFVEESTGIGTGLAIFKPDAAPEIEFQIRNQAGLDPIGEVLSWGNFQQRAQTIPEWFERVNPEILRVVRPVGQHHVVGPRRGRDAGQGNRPPGDPPAQSARTGEIRGILRDVTPPAALTRGNAAAALSLDPGVEMLTSRGIPDLEDWRR